MPSAVLLQFERRLTELACPPGQMRRKIRELAEHHEDLKRDALEEGLSETDAEARADELLGEPVVLAEHLAAALRQSSWWGRHPFIGFCLLPPLAIIPLLMLVLLEYTMGRLYFTEEQIGSLSDWETGLKYCVFAVQGAYYAVIVIVAASFCALARRTVAGFKWAGIACIMCALHGAFFFISLVPHNVTIGYWTQMHWPGALIPLLVAFAVWLKLRRTTNQLAPLPVRIGPARTKPTLLPQVPRTGFLTPTSVITVLIVAAIALLVYRAHIPVTHRTESPKPAKTIPANPAATGKPVTPTTQ